MEIYETRKRNLIDAIGDVNTHGAVAEFARKHNLDPTYVRQIINDHRKMGEKAARKFEEAIKLPAGRLDQKVEEQHGEYKVSQLSRTEMDLIAAFEASSPELKAAALRMLGVVKDIDKQDNEK